MAPTRSYSGVSLSPPPLHHLRHVDSSVRNHWNLPSTKSNRYSFSKHVPPKFYKNQIQHTDMMSQNVMPVAYLTYIICNLYRKCGCCILGYQVPSHLALSGLSPRQVMTPKGPATPTSPAAWPDVFHPSESYGPCLLSFLAIYVCFSLCMCHESSLSISLLCAMYIHVFEIYCAQQFQMLFLTASWV